MTTNLGFYLLHNCENYRNIDFSVINKDPYCVISLVKIFYLLNGFIPLPKSMLCNKLYYIILYYIILYYIILYYIILYYIILYYIILLYYIISYKIETNKV